MRRRAIQMTTAAVAVAVLLLGIPGIVLGVTLIWRGANASVESRAVELATIVEQRLEAGQDASEALLERYAYATGDYEAHVVVASPESTLEAGESLDGQDTIRHVVFAGDTRIIVEISRDTVLLRMGYAAALAVAAILFSFGIGVIVALRQSRKLSAPLIYLAAAAEQLGAGQTRPQMEKSGIEEIDLVYEELVRTADRMAGRISAERQFSADASHQLRTPLTALSMRLEEIQYLTDDPEIAEEAGSCLEQVERLAGVVQDLLAVSRSDAAGNTEAVQLEPVFEQQLDEWGRSFEQAGRKLTFTDDAGVAVLINPGSLAQIIATLIENSLKYGEGTVSVRAHKSGRGVIIQVSDEGKGVDKDVADSIFKKGFSTGGSTGIGLALARSLAESDGGRLELTQASPPIFSLALNAVPQSLNPDRILPAGSIIAVGSRRRRR
ncbi:ATP-binding protein [Actinomycetaceae bacterium L2_0104]